MNATTPPRLCACCHLPSADLQRSSRNQQALCPGCRREAPLTTFLVGSDVRELGNLEALTAAAELTELPCLAGGHVRL